jgi:hypothetical protein
MLQLKFIFKKRLQRRLLGLFSVLVVFPLVESRFDHAFADFCMKICYTKKLSSLINFFFFFNYLLALTAGLNVLMVLEEAVVFIEMNKMQRIS